MAFKGGSVKHNKNWGEARFPYLKPNQPETKLTYYVGVHTEQVTVKIHNVKGDLLRTLIASGEKGFHQIKWDMKKDVTKKRKPAGQAYVVPGEYSVTFTNGTASKEVKIKVKE